MSFPKFVTFFGMVAFLLIGSIAAQAAIPSFAYETTLSGYYLDSGRGIEVDDSGNAYVISRAIGGTNNNNIVISKLDPTGSLLWTTAIEGSGHEFAEDLMIKDDVLVVAGWTDSEDFPITADAFDNTLTGFRDAFIMKLSTDDGAIVYSTFFGGDYTEMGNSIAMNSAGEIILVGATGSTDFPTTEDAFQSEKSEPTYSFEDVFITRFSSDLDALEYSTYFGGFKDDGAIAVELDADENIIFAGKTTSDDFPLANPIYTDTEELFVAKLSADGSTLLFGTYFGGEDPDYLAAMAIDSNGSIYLTGATQSIDFPTTPGAYQDEFVGEIAGCEIPFSGHYNCDDVFVTKLNTDGTGLVYSSFLAGTHIEASRDITVDDQGRAYVVGYTTSDDFPPDGTGGPAYIFVSRFDSAGSNLDYSYTLFSGSANAGNGIALDNQEAVYFSGAINVPADTYIAKLADTSSPNCEDGCLIDNVCYEQGEVNPESQCQVCDPILSQDDWTGNTGNSCDDGLFCNGEDFCVAGQCTEHTEEPVCLEGEVCNEELDSCETVGPPCSVSESGTDEGTWPLVLAFLFASGLLFIRRKK